MKPTSDTSPPGRTVDTESHPYWNYTGVLLPYSDNVYIIVAIPEETSVPQTQYFTRVSFQRQGRQQPAGVVSHMYGWVADLHDGASFYSVPIVFHRHLGDSSMHLDTIANATLIDIPTIGDLFEQGLSSDQNSLSFKQADNVANERRR